MSEAPPLLQRTPSSLQDTYQDFLTWLDKTTEGNQPITTLAQSTSLSRGQVVVYFGSALAVLIALVFGDNVLCHFVGFVYPFYASFKALESTRTDDDTQWLTYWIVFGFFIVVESFTDFFWNELPGYQFIKMAFLVWCYLPKTRGATLVYRGFIRPVLLHQQRAIDRSRFAKTKGNIISAPPGAEQKGDAPLLARAYSSNEVERDQNSQIELLEKQFPVHGELTAADQVGKDGKARPFVMWVNMHRATNVKAADKGGTSDPYVTLTWEGDKTNKSTYKSSVIKKTLNPEWNERTPFRWGPNLGLNNLVVEVWDEDFMTSDDFLGRVKLTAESLVPNLIAYPLEAREELKGTKKADEDISGTVSLSFTTCKLKLKLLRGAGLKKADVGGKSDPFCIIRWEGETDKLQTFKSQIKPKTLDPVWDETFVMEWQAPIVQNIIIDCWDWDNVGSNDFLGRVTVNCMEMRNTLETEDEQAFELKPRPGKNDKNITGQLFLEFQRVGLPLSPSS